MRRSRFALAAALSGLVGTATMMAVATTALATEPAVLTQSLSGANGTTAAAVLVRSKVDTTVVLWSGGWSFKGSLQAGTPCSTGNLSVGKVTAKVIEVIGSYARCVLPSGINQPAPLSSAVTTACVTGSSEETMRIRTTWTRQPIVDPTATLTALWIFEGTQSPGIEFHKFAPTSATSSFVEKDIGEIFDVGTNELVPWDAWLSVDTVLAGPFEGSLPAPRIEQPDGGWAACS